MSFKDLLMYVGGKKYPVKIEVYEYIESLCQHVEDLKSTNLRQAEYVRTYKSQAEQLTETVSLLTTEGENRLQTIQQLTQERDEWLQQAEHRRVIIRDRKAQVQRLKDKLARCSAMFDEVENSLADSCRREGIFKKALKFYADKSNYERQLALGEDGEYEHPILDDEGEIAREALQEESKKDICPVCNGNNKDMACAYPSEDMKGCLRDKMVLVTGEMFTALDDASQEMSYSNYHTNKFNQIKTILRKYKAMIKAAEDKT